jgi:hypothetical protein
MAEGGFICTCCGKNGLLDRDFYVSHSITNKKYKRMHICRQCVADIYGQLLNKHRSESKAMYFLCALLDVYFDVEVFRAAKKQSSEQGSNLVGIYFQKINSLKQYKNKDFSDVTVNVETLDDLHEITYDFDVTDTMVLRWGVGLDKFDYMFLERFYNDLIAVYSHDTPVQNMLYEEMAKTRLEAERARRKGELNTYSKLMSTLSSLANDANIKPIQETGEDGKLATWGEWVKLIEETEPIPEAGEDFQDIDKIEYYFNKFFVKPFARVFGIAKGDG